MFENIFLIGFGVRAEDELIKILVDNYKESKIFCVSDFYLPDEKITNSIVNYKIKNDESHPLLKNNHHGEAVINNKDLSIINLPQVYSIEYRNLVAKKIPIIISTQTFDCYDLHCPEGNNNQIITTPFIDSDINIKIKITHSKNNNQNITKNSDNIIRISELSIDSNKYEVKLNEKKINLTFKELELLKLLASNPGRVFSRENLLKNIWDYDYYGGTRTVDVHVRRLRTKIEDHKYNFIETIWNVGYKFNENI
jgi:DNA-binding response OmpR family regulator